MSPASSSSALIPHQAPSAIASSPGTKQPPLPWNAKETTHLIQAYQEKWYSLNRGPLRANQWEEVTATLSARCGYGDQSKTVTQCRHKIEKLRKRYRVEKQRPGRSIWEFFDLMESMEHGPFPISSLPLSKADYYSESSDEDTGVHKNHRSINNLVRDSGLKRKLGNLRDPFWGKHGKLQRMREAEDAPMEVNRVSGSGSISELAAEIRAFSEKLVKMETRKMEMMRETQKCRMEMEKKKLQMIAESQRLIVDAISRTLGSYMS